MTGDYKTKPFELVTSKNHRFLIGGKAIHVVAGPCSIESSTHLHDSLKAAASAGACMYRGGIYKMRTSPDSFQGLGSAAFSFLKEAFAASSVPLISEITDASQAEEMASIVDMFQVGSRNMYNYELLKVLAKCGRPVMLKRAFSATLDEWMKASSYLTSGGNQQVVLCERGIRTFETKTRNTLDLNAVAYLKRYSELPVWVDPSHGTGRADLVATMAMAAVAAGADGLLIEAHANPGLAFSDGDQALKFEELSSLVKALDPLAHALGRSICRGPQ